MKLKLKLRIPLLVLLFLTVVSPLLFYTDTLATFSSSSWSSSSSSSAKDQFIEGISTLTSSGDTRQLKLFPKENVTALKEPVGIVYSDSSFKSSSSGEKDVHNSRQLQEDSEYVEHKTRVLSNTESHLDQSTPTNPIRLITDQVQPENQSDVVQLHEAKNDQDRHSVDLHKKGRSIVSKQTSHVSLHSSYNIL